MSWLAQNHFIAAVIAAVVCNGWVFWVTAQAYLDSLQSDIARVNYHIRIKEQCEQAAYEDQQEEI
ncbi:MAG: hypothetical protein MJH10_19980, partial [Epibacterium sp.]|nr:hypothetical protein [Epibacterium sp.]NQX75759.1 hypothetical protein [Epibacterium sp.]